jgi:hypothetical protein
MIYGTTVWEGAVIELIIRVALATDSQEFNWYYKVVCYSIIGGSWGWFGTPLSLDDFAN